MLRAAIAGRRDPAGAQAGVGDEAAAAVEDARRARRSYAPVFRNVPWRGLGRTSPTVGHTQIVNLAEWRAWWRRSGERQLRHLLRSNWDPFEDPEFEASVNNSLLDLARRLHEGATATDVRVFLSDLRHTRWPERAGRKWSTRDRRVAEKVVVWYRESTGE
jgi:hypothetical protein